MIDWLLSLFEPTEQKNWTYGRVEIPLQSPVGCCGRDDEVLYPARIRYTDDEIQIYAGKPKHVGWKTVDSENIKSIIQQQLQQ